MINTPPACKPTPKAPSITVVTATLNALPMLQHTAASIFAQQHMPLQWIVIDGGSTDGTVEWLHSEFLRRQDCAFLSEADGGVYHAFNKALPYISGDWIIFLGAGDTFLSSRTLQQVAAALPEVPESHMLAYGGVLLVDDPMADSGLSIHPSWNGVSGPWSAGRPCVPCHQGVFHRRFLFSSGCRFDTRYRIVADGDILLGELIRSGGTDLGMTISKMVKGELSMNPKNRFRAIREILLINWRSGIFWARPIYQALVFVKSALWHFVRLPDS